MKDIKEALREAVTTRPTREEFKDPEDKIPLPPGKYQNWSLISVVGLMGLMVLLGFLFEWWVAVLMVSPLFYLWMRTTKIVYNEWWEDNYELRIIKKKKNKGGLPGGGEDNT